MNDTAHIFTPKDDSLEARIEAFRNVYEAWQNAEASSKFLDDDEWRESLGSREEVERALDISIRSLRIAANSFTKEEITQATKANLIQNHEMQEIIANQRQGEMRVVRDRSQSSDSSSQSQKR